MMVAFHAAIVNGRTALRDTASTKLIPRLLLAYKGPSFSAPWDNAAQVEVARSQAIEYLKNKKDEAKRFPKKVAEEIVEVEYLVTATLVKAG